MKASAAISFGVARGKPPAPAEKKLAIVPADFALQLKALAKKHGIGWEWLSARADVSTVTAWRVTKGRGTPEAAEALRRALVAEFAKRRIPDQVPPLVLRPLPGLEEWVELGTLLREEEPAAFEEVLSNVRNAVNAIEKKKRAIAAITNPLPPRDDDD